MSRDAEFLSQAEELIPAVVHMISGCQDEQTSADVSNVAQFQLPDPAGRAGGACTSALLKVLYKDHKTPTVTLSFQEVLLEMRAILRSGRYSQVPQLTSSRPFDIKTPFTIIPDGFRGTRRAVMVGINYIGQQGQLSGCHNDLLNMREYLINVHGFHGENDIVVLMDHPSGKYRSPTRANMLAAYQKISSECKPGDAVFIHYSGHGGKVRDEDGDEKDGYDETLIPVDYASAGQITDDVMFATLIRPMPAGVTVTCLFDCCHSGTVLDLPYVFVADGTQDEMHIAPDFSFGPLLKMAQQYLNTPEGQKMVKSVMGAVLKASGKGGRKTSGNAQNGNTSSSSDPNVDALFDAVMKCSRGCAIL